MRVPRLIPTLPRRLPRPWAAPLALAAALLAVAPEAVLWGGRVRMYAPLQFFVLAATVIFYVWVVEERDRPVYPVLFVLAYWASLFHHAEAMLLLPLWGLILANLYFGIDTSLSVSVAMQAADWLLGGGG